MKVGDLVEITVFNAAGPAVITKLDEPTIRQPYQVATVRFLDDSEDIYVTTVLRVL